MKDEQGGKRDIRSDVMGGTDLKFDDVFCRLCRRAMIQHESRACRACRAGKPRGWVAKES